MSDVASTSTSHLSLRTNSSSSTRSFLPQCIFCGKLELKKSRKTERCVSFAVFREKTGTLKDPSWRQIEPRALELGMYMYDLHRMVLQGEDLYVRGAKYMYHPSCRKTFNLAYTNHLRDKSRNENHVPDTEQDSKGDAHHIKRHSMLSLNSLKTKC